MKEILIGMEEVNSYFNDEYFLRLFGNFTLTKTILTYIVRSSALLRNLGMK